MGSYNERTKKEKRKSSFFTGQCSKEKGDNDATEEKGDLV